MILSWDPVDLGSWRYVLLLDPADLGYWFLAATHVWLWSTVNGKKMVKWMLRGLELYSYAWISRKIVNWMPINLKKSPKLVGQGAKLVGQLPASCIGNSTRGFTVPVYRRLRLLHDHAVYRRVNVSGNLNILRTVSYHGKLISGTIFRPMKPFRWVSWATAPVTSQPQGLSVDPGNLRCVLQTL